MITLEITQESAKTSFLEIKLHGTQANPSDLADLEFPEATGSKGLVISGFPQWAVSAVSAEYKNRVSWIATRDDKLIKEGDDVGKPACIVTWSLSREFRRGDVVPLVSLGLEILVQSAAR